MPTFIAGCIPIRFTDGGVRACLINSRKRPGTLVFPKGRVEPGETLAEAALRETYEEAGLRGRITGEPVFLDADCPCDGGECHYFPMLVEHELTEWPEMGQRKRHWRSLKKLNALDIHDNILRVIENAGRAGLPNAAE